MIGKCLGGRQLKAMLSDPKDIKTFKQLVLEFIKRQYAVQYSTVIQTKHFSKITSNHVLILPSETCLSFC